MNDPMEVVKKLAERLRTEAEALGLHLEHVAIMPNLDGGPDFLQGVFSIKPEAVEPVVEKNEEQEAFDKMFEDLVQGEKIVEREEQNKNIVSDIANWLEGS